MYPKCKKDEGKGIDVRLGLRND